MSNLVLIAGQSTNYKPHPEGVVHAVCVDVIDLGEVESVFDGKSQKKPTVMLSFETESKRDDGKPFVVTRKFTASLHPIARLAHFLGSWRGRSIVTGENLDLTKAIGQSGLLVIKHNVNEFGQAYAVIESISKPNKRLAPSGHYDPTEARKRIEERKAGARATSKPSHGSDGQLAVEF